MGAAQSDSMPDEATDFLRRRVALFGLITGLFGLAFVALRVVGSVAQRSWNEFLDPNFHAQVGGVVFLWAAWAVCRRGPRSVGFVHAVESVGIIGSCVCYALLIPSITLVSRPELVAAIALTFTLVARAIYVPSTPTRTAALGVAVGVPFVAITHFAYRDVPDGLLSLAMEAWGPMTAADFRLVYVIMAGMFWAGTVALCAGASHVIYGLRREVTEARRLGQYVLEEKIGEGGMGAVYRARHGMLQRPTAVKLLPESGTGRESVARFEREVRLTAKLSHPNTVTIFDYGRTPDGVFYYAMELLDGATLADVVAEGGPFPEARVVHVLVQAAAALEEAHGVGLIHRDIKPQNIMLCAQGGVRDTVKILDFGLVKHLQNEDVSDGLTAAGIIAGTPHYMAPESIVDYESIDARADLYALGAVGYALLTGGEVFEGKTAIEVCSKHLHETPQRPSEARGEPVDGALEGVVLDCLAKSRDDRPQSAAELCERLRSLSLFGQWTARDADRWWNEHRARVEDQRRAAIGLASTELLPASTTLAKAFDWAGR